MTDKFTKEQLDLYLMGAVMSVNCLDQALSDFMHQDAVGPTPNVQEIILSCLEETRQALYFLAKLHAVKAKID